jgi:hypothetical protein
MTVATVTAVITVFIGSRLNPDVSGTAAGPLASDEVLAAVNVDDESFGTAIESLSRASHSKIIVNHAEMARAGIDTFVRPDRDRAAAPKQRLVNVRLGTALSLILKEFARRRVECRVDRDSILVGASPEVIRRLYDVRDIVAECDAWWGPSPQEQLAGSGGNGFPSVEEEVGDDLTAVLNSGMIDIDANAIPRGAINWSASSWGGWLIVDATRSGHLQVERFLALLRRGESADFRLKGATP